MKQGITIAIDGPVASGKGTLAPRLAEKLHGFYLPTGNMYRAVAYYCLEKNISTTQEEDVVRALPQITILFQDNQLVLNGKPVNEVLTTPTVSMGASNVAIMPKVREALVKRQQEVSAEFTKKGITVVAEGRDTGTKLFPHATLKIFLTARPGVRAKRRLIQLQEMGHPNVSLESVLNELQLRDQQDRARKTDPLVSDPQKHGYMVIDSSEQTEDETIAEIEKLLEKKL